MFKKKFILIFSYSNIFQFNKNENSNCYCFTYFTVMFYNCKRTKKFLQNWEKKWKFNKCAEEKWKFEFAKFDKNFELNKI